MKIDAHHHFWRYDPVQYDWIGEDMGALRRDFLPEHLEQEIRAAGIDGVVSVQARQSLEETAALAEFARRHDFIKGFVGWVPLVSPDVTRDLEAFAGEPKFRGVRHVLQGEADDRYMLRADFNAGIRALGRFGLVYDVLIFERHLPQTIDFVRAHPAQTFVLDHLAKPRVKDGSFDDWRKNLRELSRHENVFCKLSGLVTEAHWQDWTEDGLRPYADAVLEAFGARRTLFGSDWPVCLVACGYGRWVQVVRDFARALSADEQAELFGGTAQAGVFAAGLTTESRGAAPRTADTADDPHRFHQTT